MANWGLVRALCSFAAKPRLQGGWGKFEGEGGFSGTLRPLQGQFVMQLASTAAKVVKETTSKLESQAHLRPKGPPDSQSEHMHLPVLQNQRPLKPLAL